MILSWAIRQANDGDFAAISEWLREEDAHGVEGGFWCNINVIEDCHRGGQVTVLADGQSNQPVAFLCGSSTYPELPIMEVRSDYRRQGLGRALFEHHLDRARAAGLPGLKIHCQPPTSVPFWVAMGFQLFPERMEFKRYGYTRHHRYMVLPYRPDFDTTAPRVEIGIRITTDTGEELASALVHGRDLDGDGFELEERFTFVWPDGDPFVEVTVNGSVAHPREKIKYTTAGFRTCSCFEYLDVLEMSPDAP